MPQVDRDSKKNLILVTDYGYAIKTVEKNSRNAETQSKMASLKEMLDKTFA